jgi:hypothetical protein
MYRKLLNGQEVEELKQPVVLQVVTRCPDKYKLIDMETGQEYIGQDTTKNKYSWSKIDA